MLRKKLNRSPRSGTKRKRIAPGHSNAVFKSGDGGIGGRIRHHRN
jgi:hypothetical protein